MRFTYFLKSSTALTARLRINKDGTTFPFDVDIPSPVVGTPTEVRLPFSQFKRPFMKDPPSVVPGDTTQMIYVSGADPGCGLRIDALSLVEIRK
jgi:hypothetical protein